MEGKAALVFGATGLTGSEVVSQLLKDDRYGRVGVFVRRDPEIKHPKLITHIVGIADTDSYKDKIRGDELYICLGTTIRKAGSVRAMEAADRDVPAAISMAARENGVGAVAVVSSIGASAASRNYYLRIKGEMEQAIIAVDFDRTVIVRPSILLGRRREFRFGEAAGKVVMKAIRFLFVGRLRKYRGIEARDVAQAMIRLLNDTTHAGKIVFESDELNQ
ncbi:MAG: NAD(P)H-binding protein [Bacteroidales bacterium]|nr:NAD(P)H-binding protein [Bacteroidales bacterium]